MTRETKPRVLCLDDEPQVLESLRDTLRRKYEVVVTTNGFEALRLLASDPFDVVLTDMRMPMLDGARFLTLAREHAPNTIRVMLTGQSALPDAASAINEGQIFRLLIKPCKTAELTEALDAAVAERAERLAQLEAQERAVDVTTQSLITLAASVDPNGPARAARVRRHALELAEHVEGITSTRDLALACELMQIGAVAISAEARTRAASASRLGPEHAAEFERLPELSAPLIPPLAPLKTVAALLAATAPPFATSRPPTPEVPPGAQVLRIALDFEHQIRQGAPMDTAVRALSGRSARYDERLLATFSELMQFT
jgi:response regulator RpfG family c-di-GMP phosphodiesterase